MSAHIQTITKTAEKFESAHSEIKGRYQIKENQGCATFYIEGSDDGFSITLEEAGADEFILHAGPIHTHVFRDEGESDEDFVKDQFYHIRSLLSPLARIVEHRSGSSAYKWTLQYLHDEGWESGETMGLLFYNYFGRRSQRVLQNHLIEPPDANKASHSTADRA